MAALAHAYHDFIASRRPRLHAVLRRLWKTGTGQHFMTPNTVHGIAFPDRIVASRARVHFPYYGPLAGLSLHVDHAADVPALHATLHGRAGHHQRMAGGTSVTWAFAPTTYLADIDLEIQMQAVDPASEPRLREVMLYEDAVPSEPE
jgi:hypothetical protein